MSLQGLMSGADCAVESNPLSQVMKHTEGDRSLQQDRLGGPSSSRLHYLPGTAAGPTSERDVQLARQFFDGPQQAQVPNQGPAFAVPQYLPPPQLQQMPAISTPIMDNSSWIRYSREDVARMANSGPNQDSAWAAEFSPTAIPGSSVQQNLMAQQQQSDLSARNQYMQPSTMYGMGGMSSMSRPMYGSGMGMYNGSMMTAPPTMDKGKGKLRAEDFENAFAQAESMHQVESARIEELDEERFTGLEDAMRYTSLDTKSEPMMLPTKARDFDEVWDTLQKQELPPPKEDMQKWEAEFNQLMNSQREDEYDLEGAMNSAWEDKYGNLEQPAANPTVFNDDGIPLLGDYIFEPNNQYLSQNSVSLLSEAKALLQANGSLSEAALLLEAAIQKGELGEGGYEAWILLGETRNMDEREEAGIKALTEGVRRAHEANAGGAGMLSLAISYTNESYERAAHTMLLRWLSATYPSADIPAEAWESIKQSSWHSHDQVTQVFINLARTQHGQGMVDSDVQTGLGVLFYTSSEFDRAKDCFEAALAGRPMDYQLWNRLGSCLSNGDKHEESLGAYREALNLRPTYVRAVSNVAVACLNIGAFQEAAEHLLSALSMQNATAGETSEQLWFTLRRVFLEMNRSDLAEMTKTERRVDAYKEQGFEF